MGPLGSRVRVLSEVHLASATFDNRPREEEWWANLDSNQ